MDLAYYPGCSLYQSAKLYNHQAKLVFGILDMKLKELEELRLIWLNLEIKKLHLLKNLM